MAVGGGPVPPSPAVCVLYILCSAGPRLPCNPTRRCHGFTGHSPLSSCLQDLLYGRKQSRRSNYRPCRHSKHAQRGWSSQFLLVQLLVEHYNFLYQEAQAATQSSRSSHIQCVDQTYTCPKTSSCCKVAGTSEGSSSRRPQTLPCQRQSSQVHRVLS